MPVFKSSVVVLNGCSQNATGGLIDKNYLPGRVAGSAPFLVHPLKRYANVCTTFRACTDLTKGMLNLAALFVELLKMRGSI